MLIALQSKEIMASPKGLGAIHDMCQYSSPLKGATECNCSLIRNNLVGEILLKYPNGIICFEAALIDCHVVLQAWGSWLV